VGGRAVGLPLANVLLHRGGILVMLIMRRWGCRGMAGSLDLRAPPGLCRVRGWIAEQKNTLSAFST